MRRWAVGGVASAQLVALAWGSWLLAGMSDVEVKVFQFRPQAAKDPARAWAATRTAAGHMQQIADPLAEAIVKQFPDRYRG